MRCLYLIFLFLLLCPLANASYDWVFTSDKALFVLEVAEHASLVQFDNSRIDSVNGILDFFPRNDPRQLVDTLITFPEATRVGDSLVYKWDKPTDPDLTFSLYSHVSTSSYLVKVDKKIEFPSLIVEPQLQKYLEPTLTIDSNNPDIKQLAQSIVEGDDDYYDVVFKMADWVSKNIAYKSTQDTSDFSQKASWVLANKYGVCDEMTNLFIAMCRSMGIPAKYVSGYAYGRDGPGPHAWAEVYFPGYGWIPFDPTYSELGFIDVSHIKLKDSTDSGVPSSRYEWKGKNCQLETSQLDITTEVLNTSGKVVPLLSFELQPLSEQMALDSYDYIAAKITNDNPFYVATELEPQVPLEAVVFPLKQNVLLSPHEVKTVYWRVNLKSLPPDYSYTIPFTMYTPGNYSVSTQVIAEGGSPSFSKEEIDQMITNLEYVQPVYSSKVLLKCRSKFTPFYSDETVSVDCLVKNSGNTRLPNVYVCHDADCRNMVLDIGEKSTVTFDLAITSSQSVTFKAVAGDAISTDAVNVSIVEAPKVSIGALDHPTDVSFDMDYFIKFLLDKKSHDNPKNMLIILDSKEITKSWDIRELNESTDFMAEMKGSSLGDGKNNVKIFVSYYDQHDRRYDTQQDTVIKLDHLTLANRVSLFFSSFRQWLGNL